MRHFWEGMGQVASSLIDWLKTILRQDSNMFRKKIKWYSPSIKSLILTGFFMMVAKMFLRGIEKQAYGKKKKIKKGKRGSFFAK